MNFLMIYKLLDEDEPYILSLFLKFMKNVFKDQVTTSDTSGK